MDGLIITVLLSGILSNRIRGLDRMYRSAPVTVGRWHDSPPLYMRAYQLIGCFRDLRLLAGGLQSLADDVRHRSRDATSWLVKRTL